MPTTEAAQDNPQPPENPNPLSAEGTPPPTDESAVQLQGQLDALSRQGRVSKADAEFIDREPGYSTDQLAHMREYYGLR